MIHDGRYFNAPGAVDISQKPTVGLNGKNVLEKECEKDVAWTLRTRFHFRISAGTPVSMARRGLRSQSAVPVERWLPTSLCLLTSVIRQLASQRWSSLFYRVDRLPVSIHFPALPFENRRGCDRICDSSYPSTAVQTFHSPVP